MKKILLGMFLILIVCGKASALNTGYAFISGSIAQIKNGDSVILSVNKYGYAFSEPLLESTLYKCKIVNHRFRFKLPMGNFPLNAELQFGSKHQIKPLIGYLIENGDKIFIKANNNGILFTGNGSEKYRIIYRLEKIEENDFKNIGQDLSHPAGLRNIYKTTDVTGIQELRYLNIQKRLLSTNAFTLIKANILGLIYGEVGSIYYYNYSALKDSLRKLCLESIKDYKRNLPLNLIDDDRYNRNSELKYSGVYASSLIQKYQLDSCYLLDKPFTIEKCYNFIIANYCGALRERMVINLLYYYRGNGQDISDPLNQALTLVKNKDFLELLLKLRSSQTKGEYAYNFKLTDSLGDKHQLIEYKGKVILIDFWYTGCGNCIKIAPYLHKIEEIYANKQVVFLSVNIDKTKNQWLKSVKSGKYNSNDVVNLFTDGLELKHPICLYYSVDACPTLILIDKEGKLMQNPLDPRLDDGKSLTEQITKAL